jgi:uncharacterized protein YdeI (YjbR/CyaY-like superfamily)
MARTTGDGPRADAGPLFFPDSAALREWLSAHAGTAPEAWVGLYKKGTGRPSITWPELVDQLLCFGWIDGVRKSLDDAAYMIRITPRRPRSNWSAVNRRRFPELLALGLVLPAGLAAWEARDGDGTGEYSYERAPAVLGDEDEARFRARPEAWAFFQAQPPSYRKITIGWIASAKREETRRRRLEELIGDSAAGLRIRPLRRE